MTSKGVHSDPTRPGHSAPAPFGRSLRKLVAGSVSAFLFAAAAPAFADEPPAAAKDPEAAKVQAFADALKAKDPEAHKRFVTLHEAKDKGLADLKKAQEALKSMQGEEKMGAYQEFKKARKTYASSYMAFLDLLDELDKKRMGKIEDTIKKLQEGADQIKQVIESRKKAREELVQAAKGD